MPAGSMTCLLSTRDLGVSWWEDAAARAKAREGVPDPSSAAEPEAATLLRLWRNAPSSCSPATMLSPTPTPPSSSGTDCHVAPRPALKAELLGKKCGLPYNYEESISSRFRRWGSSLVPCTLGKFLPISEPQSPSCQVRGWTG